jgi:hypothetical protein
MKLFKDIMIGRAWLSFGWFSGEPFVLFNFALFKVLEGPPDTFVLLDIQVARLALSIGFDK